jgi:hypothetical protein
MIRASWTSTTSIETTFELWASSLREVMGRMRPLFAQEQVATSAAAFLEAVMDLSAGWLR